MDSYTENAKNGNELYVVGGPRGGGDVPIAVVQNDNISSGQVDAEAPSASREEENKFLAPWFIILVDRADTIVVRGSTIYTAIF